MTENQKLREALQAYQDANEMSPYGDYSKIEWESSAGPVNPSWGGGDCKKHGRWYGRCYSCSDEWDNLRKRADRDAYTVRENALNAAKQMARQALALPTAEQVGERDAFEREMSKPPFEFCMDRWPDDGSYAWPGNYAAYHTQCAWAAWQARAALSAGDAVDAQRYRWLMDNCTLGIKQNGVGWILNTSACVAPDCIKDVGAAIDAAMRKGQL